MYVNLAAGPAEQYTRTKALDYGIILGKGGGERFLLKENVFLLFFC
jgi:hypothetical protein